MTVSGYFFRAFFALLLAVSFGKNATAAGYFDDLTAEERAFIEQEQREQEQRELHAAMAASHHHHAAENVARERLQIEMALAADAHAQQLKQEADDLERALELSRESHRVPAAAPTAAIYATEEDEDLEAALALSMQPNTSAAAPELSAAVAAPELSEKERLRIERAKRFQSAPSIVRSIDEQVDAAFEKEKNEIQNEIHRLESINLITAYPKPQDRPNARREIDARLTELRVNLQNYTQLGKATATKLRLKSYISSQQRK
jgi:hypothetical protein